MILGLTRGSVRLVPHQPGWAAAFCAERTALVQALGTEALSIEHVGSTAVPGLPAKPILDIAVAVADFNRMTAWAECLKPLDYHYLGDPRGWDDHLFSKGNESNRSVYLHAVLNGSPRWQNYLYFRDRLRASPELRQTYARLKQNGAQAYPDDRQAYTDSKHAWIQAMLDERS
ncbi:GrpB family protein [Coraliomargarita parva]|uniref:GrpB family protein n=1 Tax=Coraliomargarita parva TaxID=3014050 RepID=UPI0022B5D691|nr:GrpB family protein [Coraliomargarita parva]